MAYDDTKTNKDGIVRDPENTTTIYAEDWNDFVEDSITKDGDKTITVATSEADSGLTISSAISNPSDNMNLFKVETTDDEWNRPLVRINDNSTTGGAANIRLDSPNPDIEFVENDQDSPAGKYELAVQGDAFQINGRNNEDNSFENFIEFHRLGKSPNDMVKIKNDTTSATANILSLVNQANSSGASPGLSWQNSVGDVTTARLSSKAGSSYTDSDFKIQVADSSKELQDRLNIDVDGNFDFKNGSFSNIDNSPLITSGTISPSTIPTKVGDQYINTSTGVTYTAIGSSSSDDWKNTLPIVTRHLGSDCSGTDSATNRVLTHTTKVWDSVMILVQGRTLHPTDEFTISGNDITFLVNIFDADIIHIYN